MKKLLTVLLCVLLLASCSLFEPKKTEEKKHTPIIKNLIVENNELFIVKGCTACAETTTVKLSEETELKDFPILNINGSISGISKENRVTVQIDYYSPTKTFTNQYATLKVQGNSSAIYPKKNFNVQFYEDDSLESKDKIKINETWGKQSKYTLKANFIDFSQARNIVSCRIYAKIAADRNLSDGLENAPNMGVVDGFPIMVFLNGSFYGIYTMNIPKDNWLFGMTGKKNPNGAIIEASKVSDVSGLTIAAATLEKDNTFGLESEFVGDSVTEQDALNSFNSFTEKIRAIDSKEKLLETFASSSSTIQRAVDCYIYSIVACADDNRYKNILYVNYDIKDPDSCWFPSIYDMDATWGLHWNGGSLFDANKMLPKEDNVNLLWIKLYTYYFDEIAERYQELRADILSKDSIVNEFDKFLKTIPEIVTTSDMVRWIFIPLKSQNNLTQIKRFLSERFEILDSIFVSSN